MQVVSPSHNRNLLYICRKYAVYFLKANSDEGLKLKTLVYLIDLVVDIYILQPMEIGSTHTGDYTKKRLLQFELRQNVFMTK